MYCASCTFDREYLQLKLLELLMLLRSMPRAERETEYCSAEQVRLVSLTGHAVGSMLETSMTSLEVPAYEMGEKVTRMIVEEIESPSDRKPSPQHLVFPAALVEREST